MTSDSVRFSVILPLYNKEESVGKTVRSVLSQTHEDLELIVVNDGSTDESLRVVRGIKDDRIRVFSQENQGVSVARNRGMDEAKYNYVAFIDGDDLWHKDYLAVMSCLISKHLAARCFSASWSAWSRIDELPNNYDTWPNQEMMLRHIFVPLWSISKRPLKWVVFPVGLSFWKIRNFVVSSPVLGTLFTTPSHLSSM